MNTRKKISFLLIAYLFITNITTVSAKSFSEATGSTGFIDREKVPDEYTRILSTSGHYRRKLQAYNLILWEQKQGHDTSGYDPYKDSRMYELSEYEDYIQSRLTGEYFYPWVMGKNIEGYTADWETGKKKSTSMARVKDLTKPLAYETGNDQVKETHSTDCYNILYLHKYTITLHNDADAKRENQRHKVWYGGEYDTVPESREEPETPAILGDSTYLVYNFVPHVLGTEGTPQYPRNGYVPSKTTDKPVWYLLNGEQINSPTETAETGLLTELTLPYTLDSDGNPNFTPKDLQISKRKNLEEAIKVYKKTYYISNIDLAFDEYLYQRNVSYEYIFAHFKYLK